LEKKRSAAIVIFLRVGSQYRERFSLGSGGGAAEAALQFAPQFILYDMGDVCEFRQRGILR
jgi:hypothetical protein